MGASRNHQSHRRARRIPRQSPVPIDITFERNIARDVFSGKVRRRLATNRWFRHRLKVIVGPPPSKCLYSYLKYRRFLTRT